jgi:hypothetical protein
MFAKKVPSSASSALSWPQLWVKTDHCALLEHLLSEK